MGTLIGEGPRHLSAKNPKRKGCGEVDGNEASGFFAGRDGRSLSLRALAQRSGVAFDTINKLELGHGPARLVTI